MVVGDVGGVAARVGALAVERDVVDHRHALPKVCVAGDVGHLYHLAVLHEDGGQVVDVGKLIARGIHLMIVGIARPGSEGAVRRGHDPRVEHGHALCMARVLENLGRENVRRVRDLPVLDVDAVEHVRPHVRLRGVVIAQNRRVGLDEIVERLEGAVDFLGVIDVEGLEVLRGL
ncbi:hypothetical protein SDC9_193885 [bioreactor metagenome]|uniref:Uncharacterized protein n=1 Tax=bioreactor metagenome TaxID=1076179 RepID=A0A645I7D7_9ZZZZ